MHTHNRKQSPPALGNPGLDGPRRGDLAAVARACGRYLRQRSIVTFSLRAQIARECRPRLAR